LEGFVNEHFSFPFYGIFVDFSYFSVIEKQCRIIGVVSKVFGLST